MGKKFRIEVGLVCTYEVFAENADEAVNQALDWFAECEPSYVVETFDDNEKEE